MKKGGTGIRGAIEDFLERHVNIKEDPGRKETIEEAVENGEAEVSKNGALATWTPPESTGRSPKDTYIVRDMKTEKNVDWDSPYNNPIEPETFRMIITDALDHMDKRKRIYLTRRVLGADPNYALPVSTITDRALTALFTYNMFRPLTGKIGRSVFRDREFLLLALPYEKLDRGRYEGKLRKDENGRESNMAVVMDFENMAGVVYGSAYGGSVKKLMFTVMNYILPEKGILPLHSSASEGENGDVALLLGLSGTGKTTLSSDPSRALYGDDEHAWSDEGIANMEYGCYAKLIGLDRKKEPEIYNAIMHKDDCRRHGAIVENAKMRPDGTFDFHDGSITPNSRGSYPLSYLTNIKESSMGGHPKTIVFLTADANGVLPPVSKLTDDQAMLWFLMAYTSKLAGTEVGVTSPKITFSRFFGQAFMPRNPEDYVRLFGKKLEKHKTSVFLINTGWTGGPYGKGKRIDLRLTRAMLHAALNGELQWAKYEENKIFHLLFPKSCPGVPPEILDPRNTWKNKKAYDRQAKKLAKEFSGYFDKTYGDKGIEKPVVKQCPGK